MFGLRAQKKINLMINVFLVFYWLLGKSQRVIVYLILRQRELLLVNMLYLRKRRVKSGVKEKIESKLLWGDDELHSDESEEDTEVDNDGANSEHNDESEVRNEATMSSQDHMIQGRERRKSS